MLTYDEALAIVLSHVERMAPETVKLPDCLGRTLASDVTAPLDLPPFDNSAVDGYAIGSVSRSEFAVVGELAAGSAEKIDLAENQACRVFTGSRLPEGTLAVVMQEDVTRHGASISLDQHARAGSHIRKRAEEVRTGDLVLEKGMRITPPALGMLATLGLTGADCYRLPRVAVVGTGSELVSPGATLAPGQGFESNTYGIQAAVRALGIHEVSIDRVRDDLDDTREMFERSKRTSEILIVCGGMSVGDHDYARPAFAALGVQELIWQVKIKPGKPFYFGFAPGGQFVFGLPGNPVSALVVFTLFVKPALARMTGRSSSPNVVRLIAGEPMRGSKGRDEFARCVVRDGSAFLTEGQGSHMLSGLAAADALVRIPADSSIAPGELVEAIELDWLG